MKSIFSAIAVLAILDEASASSHRDRSERDEYDEPRRYGRDRVGRRPDYPAVHGCPMVDTTVGLTGTAAENRVNLRRELKSELTSGSQDGSDNNDESQKVFQNIG
ncbi:hypothetical protein RvY_12006 [Ramazzottius varieornatus]|uniref:Uncharacterized protein n=1 Tax=Ramazzottius varieornatus TaxID=947166 RepID=A0A1D1VHY2_RAMVA|nr:hypothetical protein RvY_12006 [Ramazzottius varieornatus]